MLRLRILEYIETAYRYVLSLQQLDKLDLNMPM